jgi:hypothetical protein
MGITARNEWKEEEKKKWLLLFDIPLEPHFSKIVCEATVRRN